MLRQAILSGEAKVIEKIRIGVVCFGFWILNVQALPLAFTDTLYETSAIAVAGAVTDIQFDSSPPTALPLVTSATAIDTNGFASGNGIAAAGLLSTLADASSTAGLASAVGNSGFFGGFTMGGLFNIHLDFATESFLDSGAFAASSLILLLISDSATILEEVFLVGGTYDLQVLVPAGVNALQLLLSSEASATTSGSASNFASVVFEVLEVSRVPEPGTSHLLLAGLVVFVAGWSVQSRARNSRVG